MLVLPFCLILLTAVSMNDVDELAKCCVIQLGADSSKRETKEKEKKWKKREIYKLDVICYFIYAFKKRGAT